MDEGKEKIEHRGIFVYFFVKQHPNVTPCSYFHTYDLKTREGGE